MKGQRPARVIKKQRGIQEVSGIRHRKLDTFVDVKLALSNFIQDREKRGLMKPSRNFGGLEYGMKSQPGGRR